MIFARQLDLGDNGHCTLSEPSAFLTNSLLLNLDADASSDGLTHVADSEARELREIFHLLDSHWFGWSEANEAGVSGLQEGRVGLLLALRGLLE